MAGKPNDKVFKTMAINQEEKTRLVIIIENQDEEEAPLQVSKKGFAANPELARRAGEVGGAISKARQSKGVGNEDRREPC